MILPLPSFNLSMVESENIVGARPSTVLPTDEPLKRADLSSVIKLNPDKGKGLFAKAPWAAEMTQPLSPNPAQWQRRRTVHRSRSGLAWRGLVWGAADLQTLSQPPFLQSITTPRRPFTLKMSSPQFISVDIYVK